MNDRDELNRYEHWAAGGQFEREREAIHTFEELKELVRLAESVTDQIDELSEKLNRTRMQTLTVFAILYLAGIGGVVLLKATTPATFVSTLAGGITIGAGIMAVVIGLSLVLVYGQRMSKLSSALRQEFNVQQGLFTFIDDFLGTVHRREVPVSAVQLALIHMQVKRLYRPEPKRSLLSRMFGSY